MYAIYGNIYHKYTPNVSIYSIHGSYGIYIYVTSLRYTKYDVKPGTTKRSMLNQWGSNLS